MSDNEQIRAEVASPTSNMGPRRFVRPALSVDRLPPIDLLLYKRDTFSVSRYRRLHASDPDLTLIHESWEKSLRRAVEQLPQIVFDDVPQSGTTDEDLRDTNRPTDPLTQAVGSQTVQS